VCYLRVSDRRCYCIRADSSGSTGQGAKSGSKSIKVVVVGVGVTVPERVLFTCFGSSLLSYSC